MVLCGSKYKYNVPLHVFVLPYSYEFKVKPKNELGEGPPSEPVTFNTESGNAFYLYCFLVESLLRTIHIYKMLFFFLRNLLGPPNQSHVHCSRCTENAILVPSMFAFLLKWYKSILNKYMTKKSSFQTCICFKLEKYLNRELILSKA